MHVSYHRFVFFLMYVYEFLLIDFPLNYILSNAANFWLVLGNIINLTLFFKNQLIIYFNFSCIIYNKSYI